MISGRMVIALVLTAEVVAPRLAEAQAPTASTSTAPAAAPPTMWNFLGLPKNPLDRLRNREGNFPGNERRPPLRPIADPSNLESDVPAIKTAAEIKQQEDLAEQKIKAIKYLAEQGCEGCYEGVGEALAAALDDCTEAVRYEAAKAILATAQCGDDRCDKQRVRQTKTWKEALKDARIAHIKQACARMKMLCGRPSADGETRKSRRDDYGDPCQPPDCPQRACGCGAGECCNADVLNKLSETAFERDDRGCYKEPSARVRAMAQEALRACRERNPPRPWEPEPAAPEAVDTPEVIDLPNPVSSGPGETAPSGPGEAAPSRPRGPASSSSEDSTPRGTDPTKSDKGSSPSGGGLRQPTPPSTTRVHPMYSPPEPGPGFEIVNPLRTAAARNGGVQPLPPADAAASEPTLR